MAYLAIQLAKVKAALHVLRVFDFGLAFGALIRLFIYGRVWKLFYMDCVVHMQAITFRQELVAQYRTAFGSQVLGKLKYKNVESK
jgi:hypothetical protein